MSPQGTGSQRLLPVGGLMKKHTMDTALVGLELLKKKSSTNVGAMTPFLVSKRMTKCVPRLLLSIGPGPPTGGAQCPGSFRVKTCLWTLQANLLCTAWWALLGGSGRRKC